MVLLPAASREEWAALCPVLVVCGTCLVIRFAAEVPMASWFNNRVLQWLGAISFSLYLVHMPLIAFYRTWWMLAPDAVGMLTIILLSLGLAWLFYHGVEKRKPGWPLFICLFVAAAGICVMTRYMNGFKDYIHVESNRVVLPLQADVSELKYADTYTGFDREAIRYNNNIFSFADKAFFQGDAESCLMQVGDASRPPSFVLFGDSHASSAFPGMNVLCREMGVSGVYVSSVVFPFWDWDLPPLSFDKSYYCDEAKVRALLAWLRQHPELTHVVISQYWGARYREKSRRDWGLNPVPNTAESYAESLSQFVAELQQMGKEVVLLAPFPLIEEKQVIKRVRTALRLGLDLSEDEALACSRDKYMRDHGEVLALLEKVAETRGCTLLRTLDYIPQHEPFRAVRGGRILYKDGDHMTADGSVELFRFLRPQLEAIWGEVL